MTDLNDKELEVPQRPTAPKIDRFRFDSLQNWSDAVPTSRTKLMSIATIVLLAVFGVGGTWAATAKLGGALVSSGKVFAEGNNHVIQHLEGGILQELDVLEGEHVERGRVIARLDETANRSQLDRVEVQKALNLIELQRWRTERDDNAEEFTVDRASLAPVAEHPRVVEALQSQIAEFRSARESRQQQLLILDGKIANEKADISYLQDLLKAYNSQKELLQKEEESYSELLDKGLTRQSQVLALQRQLAQIDAQRANAIAAIKKSDHNIQSYLDEKQGIYSAHAELVSQKITKVQQSLNENEDYVTRLEDALRRANITTPVSGTVLNLPIKSIGAVIKPGEDIAEILPSDARLLLEVPISPKDITKVFVDQEVEIVFPSDQVSVIPPLKGKVSYISADTFTQQNKGVSYYLVHIEMSDEHHGRNILPGNVAEVYFQTEPKTLVEYLAEPITRFALKTYTE